MGGELGGGLGLPPHSALLPLHGSAFFLSGCRIKKYVTKTIVNSVFDVTFKPASFRRTQNKMLACDPWARGRLDNRMSKELFFSPGIIPWIERYQRVVRLVGTWSFFPPPGPGMDRLG